MAGLSDFAAKSRITEKSMLNEELLKRFPRFLDYGRIFFILNLKGWQKENI